MKIFNNFPTTALELILVNKNKKKILRTSNVPIHGPRKSPRNFQYTMKSRRDSCLLWHYIYGTPCTSAPGEPEPAEPGQPEGGCQPEQEADVRVRQ